MQQLTQKLGSGDMIIQEVPYPQLGKGMVIVKNQVEFNTAFNLAKLKCNSKLYLPVIKDASVKALDECVLINYNTTLF